MQYVNCGRKRNIGNHCNESFWNNDEFHSLSIRIGDD